MGDRIGDTTSIQGVGADRVTLLAHQLSGARSRHGTERVIGGILLFCGVLSIATTVGIVVILAEQAVEFFREISIFDFLFGTQWTPLFEGQESYGVLALVSATLMIGALSMLIAIPFGLMSAIYLSEYASPGVRSVLKPILELLAGIPTIVYGYFALTFITPNVLKRIFPDINPYNLLSASIAVGIMVLPMVASLSEDAFGRRPTIAARRSLWGRRDEVRSVDAGCRTGSTVGNRRFGCPSDLAGDRRNDDCRDRGRVQSSDRHRSACSRPGDDRLHRGGLLGRRRPRYDRL